MGLHFVWCRMQNYNLLNRDTHISLLMQVQGQINEVKSTLTENINKVLARGEKIELLVDKTEQLNMSANKFQKSARTLKRAMWWKNVKMWIVIIVVSCIFLMKRYSEAFSYLHFFHNGMRICLETPSFTYLYAISFLFVDSYYYLLVD